jgi:hypothetical protein
VSFEFFRNTLQPQEVSEPFCLGSSVLKLDTSSEVDLEYVYEWVVGEIARA